MKTFKVVCFDEKNNIKYEDVEIKKSFDHFGYTWCIHRPPKYKTVWVVSEYQTGMKCSAPENTIAAAEREAIRKLDDMGIDRTESSIKLAIEQRGIINKE